MGAYASHDRVVAGALGASSVTVCEQADPPEKERPCIQVKGAPVSEQGASLIRDVGKLLWEAAKLLISLL